MDRIYIEPAAKIQLANIIAESLAPDQIEVLNKAAVDYQKQRDLAMLSKQNIRRVASNILRGISNKI